MRVIPVLSSGDRGQENPAVARRELLRQAYTPQPDFNRVGSEQAQRPCPKMTNEGYPCSVIWGSRPGKSSRRAPRTVKASIHPAARFQQGWERASTTTLSEDDK